VVEPEYLLSEADAFAAGIAHGPTAAHAMTKEMLLREWDMGVIDAIEAEAEAQALCMESKDFRRAYDAFVQKRKPEFKGD
jgi:enoyl-CoA hydratase/carnithine racemase